VEEHHKWSEWRSTSNLASLPEEPPLEDTAEPLEAVRAAIRDARRQRDKTIRDRDTAEMQKNCDRA
jgi:hypothetical protein